MRSSEGSFDVRLKSREGLRNQLRKLEKKTVLLVVVGSEEAELRTDEVTGPIASENSVPQMSQSMCLIRNKRFYLAISVVFSFLQMLFRKAPSQLSHSKH